MLIMYRVTNCSICCSYAVYYYMHTQGAHLHTVYSYSVQCLSSCARGSVCIYTIADQTKGPVHAHPARPVSKYIWRFSSHGWFSSWHKCRAQIHLIRRLIHSWVINKKNFYDMTASNVKPKVLPPVVRYIQTAET